MSLRLFSRGPVLLRTALLVFTGLGLGGCGAIFDQFQSPAEQSPPSAQPHQAEQTQPAQRPSGETAPTPPRPTARPTPPAQPKAADPSELSGLDESAVTALLGPPAESRAQGSGRLLAWKSPQCTFDVILFMDVTDGAWRVLSWDMDHELREPGTTRVSSVAACYGSVKGGR